MKIKLEYHQEGITVEIPEGNLIDILKMKPVPPLPDVASEVKKTLSNPIGCKPLSDLVKGRREACVVISDISRAVSNKIILPPLLKAIEESGIKRDRITILIATGIHKPNEGEELIELVGEEVAKNYRLVNHLAKDLSCSRYLGKTKRGTPVYVNKLYHDSDLKILTGLIEPHFMAGFSGGRKSICPGICALDTVKVVHGPEFLEEDSCASGILEGNPFHEEILEIAKMARVDFILNVTIDEVQRITGVFGGELEKAHREGVEFLRKFVEAEVKEEADIVVSSGGGYPLDTTFYQAVKGMVAALPVVKRSGTIIVAAGCRSGIGSPEYEHLLRETKDIDKFMEMISQPNFFIVDQWEIEEQIKALRKAEIYFYTDGIPSSDLKELLVTPIPSVEEGIKRALVKYGEQAKIIVIPKGPYMIPLIKPAPRHQEPGTRN